MYDIFQDGIEALEKDKSDLEKQSKNVANEKSENGAGDAPAKLAKDTAAEVKL